jgi:hypothetical protein
VVSLGRYILAIDRDFFRESFSGDAQLSDCVHRVAKQDREAAQRYQALHPQQPAEEEPPKAHAGDKGLRAGGYMLGIGLVVGVVSLGGLSAGAFPFVFGLTAGVLLVGIGLLVLLVSALIYAAND